MSVVLLAQVSQAMAQGPEASPTMDFFEFLGRWSDEEGNFLDPMLLDTVAELDQPIQEQNGERSQTEGEDASDGAIQAPPVDHGTQPKYDE